MEELCGVRSGADSEVPDIAAHFATSPPNPTLTQPVLVRGTTLSSPRGPASPALPLFHMLTSFVILDTHIETLLLISHGTQLTKSHMPVTSKHAREHLENALVKFSCPFLFLFNASI